MKKDLLKTLVHKQFALRFVVIAISGFTICHLLSDSTNAATTLQTTTAKETPDPYFNQPIKPRTWPVDSKSLNTSPAESSDFQIVLPNQPSIDNPPAPLSGFVAERKPQKGPVIVPPLREAAHWVAPKTPVSGGVRVATNHTTQTGGNNFSLVSPSQPSDSIPNTIIREQPQTPPRSFTATPVETGTIGATSQSPENSFAFNKTTPPGTETDNSFTSNAFTNNAVSDISFSPTAPKTETKSDFTLKQNSNFNTSTTNNDFGSKPKTAQSLSAPGLWNDGNAEVTGTPAAQPNFVSTNQPPRQEVNSRGRRSFEPSKVMAIVGGEPIFVGDMMFEINQLIEKFMPTAPEDIKQRERQKLIPRILPKFVEGKLLYHGMLAELPDEVDVEKVLEQASAEFDEKALGPMIKNSGLKSAGEFDAHLRAQGSSLRNLRRSWGRDQLTKYFLGQQLQVTTEVTHQQMLDEYRKNFAIYEIKGKARWEQLMIRFDRSDSPAAAKKQIAALGDQVVYGANFAAVAKKGSHGFSASEGGQHDWTSRGALVLKEIDNAIFELPIGELSDIIETANGYHIVRVIERTDDHYTPFLEAQVEIKKRILDEQRKAAFDKHLAKLKKEIPVEYPFDAEALMAEAKQGLQTR